MGGRILCYHSVGQPEFGVNDVAPLQFRRQIEAALKAGFRFAQAGEIARGGGDAKTLAVTFDDGLKSVVTQAMPILRDHGIPWTVFAVSDWCDGRNPWMAGKALTWAEIETMLEHGGELGSHSATHPDFAALSPERAAEELAGSRETIRRRLGFSPASFAIPFGLAANWPAQAQTWAREAGYELIYAQAEETRAEGTIGRSFVTRFDDDRAFAALLAGRFDAWEEWC